MISEKLQSYYEAFVQLDKENHVLKVNVQELCEKLKKYEDRVLGDKTNKINDNKVDEVINNVNDKKDQPKSVRYVLILS